MAPWASAARPLCAQPPAPRVPRRERMREPIALCWFFPAWPRGALSDPACHIFRGPGPQGLVGGKAHHGPQQVHRADGPTRGAFHGPRLCLPQGHPCHIDGPGKGTCGWECLRRGSSYRIARRRTHADTSAPSGRVCGPLVGWRGGVRARP